MCRYFARDTVEDEERDNLVSRRMANRIREVADLGLETLDRTQYSVEKYTSRKRKASKM